MERRNKRLKLERPKKSGSITDLHHDLLKEILLCVARSSDGGKSLVRAVSTCKALRGLVDDGDVLRAVAFDKLWTPERCELFHHTGGLVTRCAQAGHEIAQFILAKIIIVSSSKLESLIMTVDTDDLHLPHYLKQRTQFDSFVLSSSGLPQIGLNHCDLVKLFLSQAKVTDIANMLQYFPGYVRYFFGSLHDSSKFCSLFINADILFKTLRLESDIFRTCKRAFNLAYDLMQDCKVRDEQAYGLVQDFKLKHEHIFVQLAEVKKRDLCDANFYSMEFYESVIKALLTLRAAMEKETATVFFCQAETVIVEAHESILDLIVTSESSLSSFKIGVSGYIDYFASIISAFDQLCHIHKEETNNSFCQVKEDP